MPQEVTQCIYLVAEEEDYILAANTELMRGNDKFMKELKKKREMLAKIKLEMSPKKP